MEWMIAPLRKYADFSGRARRREFWMFYLFFVLVNMICHLVVLPLGTFGSIFSLLVALVLLIPVLAVGVRRLHDIGKSGAWILLIFAPPVGTIILLVFFCTEGTFGQNQYGFNPKTGE